MLLLNNHHLGTVVQWEDRFFKGSRAHTYLGPIDNPEACGQGDGISPDCRYPDFVAITTGLGWQAETVVEKTDLKVSVSPLLRAERRFLVPLVGGPRVAGSRGTLRRLAGSPGRSFDRLDRILQRSARR